MGLFYFVLAVLAGLLLVGLMFGMAVKLAGFALAGLLVVGAVSWVARKLGRRADIDRERLTR